MKKQIRDLKPGDLFRDSIGCLLRVLEVGPEKSTGIPRTKPKIRLYFATESGNKMFCDYSADRRVEVLEVKKPTIWEALREKLGRDPRRAF